MIGDAIQAGMIRAVDDAVEIGIGTIRQRLRTQDSSTSAAETDEWTREFDGWVAGHLKGSPLPTDEAIDRESIYGSRGD